MLNSTLEIHDEVNTMMPTVAKEQHYVNQELMFTIAQVSATFVAIMAGFYTTKILSISNERNSLRNKIKEIDTELSGKEKIIKSYKDIVDRISLQDAEESINRYIRKLLKIKDLREYTIDELKDKFIELMEEELNDYEEKIVERDHNSIMEKIKKELENRKPKPGLLALGFSLGNLDDILSMPMLPQHYAERYRTLRENREKLLVEEARREYLRNMKNQYIEELKSTAFPQYAGFGMLSIFGFAIAGVVIPLIHHIWSPVFGVWSDTFALSIFMLGLLATFVYIILEVSNALKS